MPLKSMEPTGAVDVIKNLNLSGADCLKLWSSYLWTSGDGKLRISGGVPATDTGGEIVGAQS